MQVSEKWVVPMLPNIIDLHSTFISFPSYSKLGIMPVPFLIVGLKNTTNKGCIERGLGVMGCVLDLVRRYSSDKGRERG